VAYFFSSKSIYYLLIKLKIMSENKTKLGQEPAFPVPTNCRLKLDSNGNVVNSTEDGMSKRFYAACFAMQGLISHYGVAFEDSHVQKAFYFADKLLEQENMPE
jgi:hypothetical protein